MKVSFHFDTDDNLAARESDLSAAIALVLGKTFTLSRLSGQFNESELKTGGNAPLVDAVVQLPASATPASTTAASVSLPTASSSSASAVSGDLDVTGIPHDPRIHAKPAAGNAPTKNADGRWKKKKGVDDATFAQVTAELLQLVKGVANTSAPALPTAAAALPEIKADQPALPSVAPAALPQLPPVTLPNKAIEVVDFASFAEWAAAQTSEKFEPLLNQILTHYGMVDAAGAPQLAALGVASAAEPGLIKTFHNWLRVQL